MRSSTAAIAALAAAAPVTADTVVGVYIFHRHGDRTPKVLAPANLTDLGYAEVFQSGDFYRSRYVDSNASSPISGLSPDLVNLNQYAVSASVDNVLMNSAQGFSQALYPAVQSSLSTDSLRNGTNVSSPLNGYQLIPVAGISSGAGSESNGWLQASTNCGNAITSSNEYFSTPEYAALYNSSLPFYQSLGPVVNSTINADTNTYKNAYLVFDYVNVANIHNRTIPSSNLLTPSSLGELQGLAAVHEYNLAYNASSPIRGIAGMQLAAQAMQYLNSTFVKPRGPKLGVQFGNYGTMTSYFGLANMTNVPGAPGSGVSFSGIPDYASSLVWEVFQPGNGALRYPLDPSGLQVRFYFHNGSTSAASPPAVYPLFGNNADSMSWNDFASGTNKFAVGNTQQWCTACGNSTGVCAAYAPQSNGISSGSGNGSSGSGSGISNAVAGVIGAMVTLGVIALVEVAVILLFGLRLVSRRRLAATPAAGAEKSSASS